MLRRLQRLAVIMACNSADLKRQPVTALKQPKARAAAAAGARNGDHGAWGASPMHSLVSLESNNVSERIFVH
jgi:hypothetical protein